MQTVIESPLHINNRIIPNHIAFHPMEGCDGTLSEIRKRIPTVCYYDRRLLQNCF